MAHWKSFTQIGNHNIRWETRHTVCSSRYHLSAEWFFTPTSHYCSGERLILKPLNFGGRWQNCQFPHGGKSQLASPHLLSAGRKSYYFFYIKIWNMLQLAHRLLLLNLPKKTFNLYEKCVFMVQDCIHESPKQCSVIKIVKNVKKHLL